MFILKTTAYTYTTSDNYAISHKDNKPNIYTNKWIYFIVSITKTGERIFFLSKKLY